MNKPLKSRITITIDSGLLTLLKQLSDNRHRSLSNLINHVLQSQLRNYMEETQNENSK